MATWKKVIVSGSAAELLNVTASAANITTLNVTAGSGSFSGSFQGNGSGLTGVSAQVEESLLFGNGLAGGTFDGLTAVTASLDTGSAHFISGSRKTISSANTTGASGINLAYNQGTGVISGSLVNSSVTLGTTTVDLGATATTLDGLTLTAVVATGSFTGSFSGSFVGTTDLPDLTAGTGISTFTYDGATIATVEVSGASTLSSDKISKWTGTAFANSSLTDNGTTITGTTSIQLTGASSNLSGSFSGSFTGDGSGLTNLVSNLNFSGSTGTGTVDLKTQSFTIAGTANEIETSAAGQTITIGLPNDVTIGNNLIVNNNLTVLGTASFQNTTNLEVADRFILLASGSNTATDGGIVIQQGVQNVGELFAFDSDAIRWGLTGSFSADQSSYTPDAFMAAVVVGAGTDPNAAPARYDAAGNIFIGTDESIYIYS
jgi:hypothetical protein